MGIVIVWPAIGWDIRMFHMRPIDPAGGRRRKNTCTENGCAPWVTTKGDGTAYVVA